MVIVYASNTGYTKEYAKILMKEFDVPAYSYDNIPEVHHGHDVVYLGWIMAGNIYGYSKVAKLANVICAIGVGMSPEDPEMADKLREKTKIPAEVPVFYVQGGYDNSKLKGGYKLIMKGIAAGIKKKMEKEPEEERDDATWKMVNGGYSAVSPERLADAIACIKELTDNK